MSSTSLCSAGSDDAVGVVGGNGGGGEDASVVVAVASERVARRPGGVRSLCARAEWKCQRDREMT